MSRYMAVAKNYRSAEENSKGLEDKFRKDEVLGLMFSTMMEVLYPSQEILVAALGAIKKPDRSVRSLHDGMISCNTLVRKIRLESFGKFMNHVKRSSPFRLTSLLRIVV